MRRIVVVATAVVALLGVLSPPASAQAPAPKVTINGLIDTVTVGGKNINDGNYASAADSNWHARNRGVFTFTGEVGKAKGVLAIEMDFTWGQSGTTDGAGAGQVGSNAASNGGFGTGATIPFTNAGADLGVDIANSVFELKNLYVEFPVPWIPMATMMRLGAQPTQVTMKPSVLFTTDYPGVWLSTTINPWLKFNLTYAQIEEQFVGTRASVQFIRGDDFVVSPSFDIEPMKGVKLRPFWTYFLVQGNTYSLSRCRVQCAGLPSNGTTATITQTNGSVQATSFTGLGNYRFASTENRHFLGIDAQTNFGPFYFDPTVIYETSNVDVWRTAAAATGAQTTALVASTGPGTSLNTGVSQATGQKVNQSIRSWLVDARGGWRAGPLMVEGIFVWTPGDDAHHDSFKTSKVYHPVSTDGAGWGGWADIMSPGTVDYLTGAAPGINENGGLGRYGIVRAGGRASYALTPAFTVRGGWNSWWTDTKVATDSPVAAAGIPTSFATGSYGAVPCSSPGQQAPASITWCQSQSSTGRGTARYIGSEFSVGASYAFAPGLAFDIVGAYLFAGNALDSATPSTRTGNLAQNEAADASLVAARVRYQF